MAKLHPSHSSSSELAALIADATHDIGARFRVGVLDELTSNLAFVHLHGGDDPSVPPIEANIVRPISTAKPGSTILLLEQNNQIICLGQLVFAAATAPEGSTGGLSELELEQLNSIGAPEVIVSLDRPIDNPAALWVDSSSLQNPILSYQTELNTWNSIQGALEVYAQPEEPELTGVAIVWADTNDIIVTTTASAEAALPTRATSSVLTEALAVGATKVATITLAASYRLYRITVSASCRVRLYTTMEKRDADLDRLSGVEPLGDHGVILDFSTTDALFATDLIPVVNGWDGKTVPDGAIPVSITNLSENVETIRIDLLWIRCE